MTHISVDINRKLGGRDLSWIRNQGIEERLRPGYTYLFPRFPSRDASNDAQARKKEIVDHGEVIQWRRSALIPHQTADNIIGSTQRNRLTQFDVNANRVGAEKVDVV